MTETKFFQLRDRGTHIPVVCVLLLADDTDDSREMRRAGFGVGTPYFLLTNLLTLETHYGPFDWGDRVTTYTAHRHIEDNWAALESGQVIDAEYIRGERTEPRCPE